MHYYYHFYYYYDFIDVAIIDIILISYLNVIIIFVMSNDMIMNNININIIISQPSARKLACGAHGNYYRVCHFRFVSYSSFSFSAPLLFGVLFFIPSP